MGWGGFKKRWNAIRSIVTNPLSWINPLALVFGAATAVVKPKLGIAVNRILNPVIGAVSIFNKFQKLSSGGGGVASPSPLPMTPNGTLEEPSATIGSAAVMSGDNVLNRMGLGTVASGTPETYEEAEEKKKTIKKKKLGTRALQIPLQTTTAAQGISGTVSATGGLQI